MKALVTGAAGFVGRHTVRDLTGRGWTVDSIDTRIIPETPGGRRFHIGVESLVGNGYLGFQDRYDLVVHCAAVVGGRENMEANRLDLLARNLEIDAAMFRWAARSKVDRFIYISSSAVYPTAYQTDKRRMLLEESMAPQYVRGYDPPMEPDISYGFEKLVGERLAEEYRAAGGKVTVVRPFSGYGEDQDLTYPFPTIIKQVKEKPDQIRIWHNTYRDFIHIHDFVHAMLFLASNDVDGPVNLCTGQPTAMYTLVQLAYRVAWGRRVEIIEQTDKPAGVLWRVGSPELLQQYYTPRISLEEGVVRALRS